MRAVVGFLLLFITVNVFAQRTLKYEDRSKENAVFGGEANEACVTFSSSMKIIPLFFENNKQKAPAKIDTIGANVNYHLVFDARPGRESRTINIYVDGFSPLTMQWFLTPKQQLNYYIYDPDSTIVDCYNQLMREGLNLFKNGMYEEAKAKYESVKDCSNLKDEEKVNSQIAMIDSILIWRNSANAAFNQSEYAIAIENFLKIYKQNPEDKYIANRLSEAQTKQREECIANFQMAETFFSEKDYRSAQPLYEKVISKSCNEMPQAIKRLREIQINRQRPHVLTYEFSQNTPIGFSTGNYKDHKASGYFTLRLNSALFETLRTNNDSTLLLNKKPELNISFGWTVPIIKPVWIFFGPGYTAVGRYIPDSYQATYYTEDGFPYESTQSNLVLKINSAISPEVGLLGKIIIAQRVGVVLRYTFQYRFALDKAAQDYIGNIRSVFGIGICF